MVSRRAGDRFDETLARARREDPLAFAELVRQVEWPLVGFLRARGAEDAEDLANDVLVRVFGNIGRFVGSEAQYRAWVFKIARNALIDEHRHRASRPESIPSGHQELPEDGAVDDVLERIDQRERVDAMLRVLTDEQREVVLLRIVADLSVDETAQVVGRRPGAVRALQHRALTQLRAAFSKTA